MWVVAFEVSKQPPWSMATSTITAPFFMVFSISRVTSLGAFAPVTSTAPTTTSASRTSLRTVAGDDMSGKQLEGITSLRWRRRSRLMSRMYTLAPRPQAMRAAWVPTTPPPMTTTVPGSTPGTPPSSTPLPPWAISRYLAPCWMAMRPATSLMGVSRGRLPSAFWMVS